MVWLVIAGMWLVASVAVLGVVAAVVRFEDWRDERRNRRPGYILDDPKERTM